jgi:hypothetical protein
LLDCGGSGHRDRVSFRELMRRLGTASTWKRRRRRREVTSTSLPTPTHVTTCASGGDAWILSWA